MRGAARGTRARPTLSSSRCRDCVLALQANVVLAGAAAVACAKTELKRAGAIVTLHAPASARLIEVRARATLLLLMPGAWRASAVQAASPRHCVGVASRRLKMCPKGASMNERARLFGVGVGLCTRSRS